MKKNIYYSEIQKFLIDEIRQKSNLNVLEIGCGSKIYKKLFINHNYEGLDLPNSEYIDKNDLPDFQINFKNFIYKKKYDFIFSVTAIAMMEKNEIENLVKLISDLKKDNVTCLIFDWKKKTILRNPKIKNCIYNNYVEILSDNFGDNMEIINSEWCSNNIVKKRIKEIFHINTSHVIKIKY